MHLPKATSFASEVLDQQLPLQKEVLVEPIVSAQCCRSTILSVANWSEKMPVHGRTDIEYQRTEPVTHLERSIGAALVDAGSGAAAGGK